jgi:hypothetical protein
LQCVQVNTAATVSVCIGSTKQHHAAAPDLVRFHKFDVFPSLKLRGSTLRAETWCSPIGECV